MARSDRLRDRWIDWILRHDRAVLLVALVATIVAGVFASRLQVDSDLRRLLPRDHEVVRSIEAIEDTFGSTGSVNVVVRGSSAEARHAFSDALAAALQGNPSLRDVDYRLPSDFFTRHALYYLTDAEIAELQEKIDAWQHSEMSAGMPDAFLLEPDPEAKDKLEEFIRVKRGEASDRTGFADYYERDGVDANVILLHPVQPAADLEFARSISEEMRGTVQEVFGRSGSPWSGTDLSFNVVGPYINKAAEQAIIKRDTLRAGTFAALGVMLVLYLLFRSTRAVIVLLVPLSCGVVWSLAATYLVIGGLNVATSMISTVVMGAGIDAGIHFYARARRQRRSHDNDAAIREAFGNLIVPLLVASSTTVGAFAIMAISEFPLFREFGIIAAMGVALCLLAMTTVLPALSHAVGIKRTPKPKRLPEGLLSRVLLARPGIVLAVLTAITGVAALGALQVEFEYNGRALQSDSTRIQSQSDVELISEIFGRDIHAGILIRDSLAQSRAALESARSVREELGSSSVVAELMGLPDLLPDPDLDLQTRRARIELLLEEDALEELEEIAGIESELRRQKAIEDGGTGNGGDDWDEDLGEEDWDGESEAETKPKPKPKPKPDKEKLNADEARLLIRMLDAQPFGEDDLPPTLLRRFRTKDGSYGVFAYPSFDAADMRKGVEFSRETSSYLAGEDALFVGETTVYAAMFLLMQDEAPTVLIAAAVFIAVLVYWQLRSMRQALMTLLPLVLALWWLVGVMGSIDLRFTLFNLPILPAILGIGVDNGVYLTDRIRRSKGEADGLVRSLQEAGSAIMAAMSTTAIGFAAFMIADSAGVRGIGAVAVLGIVFAALGATLVLPAGTGLVRGVIERRR